MSFKAEERYGCTSTSLSINPCNSFANEMLGAIDEFEARAQCLGDIGGLDTGFSRLTDKLEGLQPGLYMISAGPNVGKTAFCTQLAWQIAQNNPTAFCMYITLDDNPNIVIQRVVAHITGLPIRVIRNPRAYAHDWEILATRQLGLSLLREAANSFVVPSNINDTDVDAILEYALRYLVWVDATDAVRNHLVLFIDNFYDLTCRMGGDNSNIRMEYIADQLKRFAMRYNVPVICTGELRKLNGPKRPSLDDAKGAGGLAYAAQIVLGIYNEVGQRGDAAKVYWSGMTNDKMPVLEVHFLKNKLSSFKGRLLYRFIPSCSTIIQMNEQDEQHLNKVIFG